VMRVVVSVRGSVDSIRIGRVLQSVHVTHFGGKSLWHSTMTCDIKDKIAASKLTIKEMQNARKLNR